MKLTLCAAALGGGNTIKDTFDKIISYTIGTLSVGDMLRILVTAAICLILAKILIRIAKKAVEKIQTSKTVKNLIESASKILIYFIAVLITAESAGIPVSSLLAAFSVVGLALSLAAKDFLTGIISGVTVLVTKPFIEGDYVEIGAKSGTVDKIDLIYTTLLTVDHKTVKIPNQSVCSAEITNYTRMEKRRVDISVSPSYNDAIDDVRKSLLKAADRTPQVLKEEAIAVYVKNYGESSIEYKITAWCKNADYLECFYALTEEIKRCFDEDSIEMSYNHLNVHLDK